MCWMCYKGYSHPSLDDKWEFCWDRVLDAKDCGDDEENWARYISHQWLIFPNFLLWSRPKHNVVLCLLGHMVYFIIYGRAALSFQDYMDFMRRARRKIINSENGCRNMGTTWTYVYVFGDTLRMTKSIRIFGGVMECCVVINLKLKKYEMYVQRQCSIWRQKYFTKVVTDHFTHVIISSEARRSLLGRAPVFSLST